MPCAELRHGVGKAVISSCLWLGVSIGRLPQPTIGAGRHNIWCIMVVSAERAEHQGLSTAKNQVRPAGAADIGPREGCGGGHVSGISGRVGLDVSFELLSLLLRRRPAKPPNGPTR